MCGNPYNSCEDTLATANNVNLKSLLFIVWEQPGHQVVIIAVNVSANHSNILCTKLGISGSQCVLISPAGGG